MDYKRASWMTVLMYVLSFIIGILSAPYFGYGGLTEAPTEIFLFGLGTSIILVVTFTKWYFMDKNIKPTLEHGIQFGLFIVGLSFVLDFILILPVLLSSTSVVDPLAYYAHPLFWATVVAIPIASGVTSAYLEKDMAGKKQTKKTSRKAPAKKKKTTRKKK